MTGAPSLVRTLAVRTLAVRTLAVALTWPASPQLALHVGPVPAPTSAQPRTVAPPAPPAPQTPAAGSAERTAILDAARAPLERELRQVVRFRVDHLRVHGAWAFLSAVPQRTDARSIRYAGTPWAAAVDAGAFDEQVSALLRRDAHGWRVVAWDLGATDVVWENWPTRFGAPRDVFPSW